MSLWSKIVGRGENDYVYLREAFENHHSSVEKDLNQKHPHAAGSLARYGVDLKTLRKRAASVVAAAAVAGLLLSLPHKVGAPINTHQQQSKVEGTSSQGNGEKANSGKNITKNQVAAVNQDSEIATPPSGPATPPPGSSNDEKGHRGHTRGRSYLAPPKEHGLHDLGLHKGDKNAPHPIKNVKGERL